MKGSPIPRGGRLASRFLAELRSRRYSPKTILVYGTALRDLLRFLASKGIHDIRAVTPNHLMQYRSHLLHRKLRPATVDLFSRSITRFFSYLRKKDLIIHNPSGAVPRIRFTRRLMPVPTDDDMRILLSNPDTVVPLGLRDRAILETAYSTGIRLAELAGIQLGDLDLRNNTLRVLGKGNQERVVPVGQHAALWIGRYLEIGRPHLTGAKNKQPLWFGERHDPLDYDGMRSVFRKHGRAKGLSCRVTPHSFRRACATAMLMRPGAHARRGSLRCGASWTVPSAAVTTFAADCCESRTP